MNPLKIEHLKKIVKQKRQINNKLLKHNSKALLKIQSLKQWKEKDKNNETQSIEEINVSFLMKHLSKHEAIHDIEISE